jgi:ketosteroid isomerase-like protein
MSEENLERARAAVEAWNEGRREDVFDLLDAAVEIETPFSSVAGTPYVGADGYRRWVADVDQQFESFALRVDEYRTASEGRVVAIGAAQVRGRGSGVELLQPAVSVLDFREGRVSRLRIYADTAAGLRAAGLQE